MKTQTIIDRIENTNNTLEQIAWAHSHLSLGNFEAVSCPTMIPAVNCLREVQKNKELIEKLWSELTGTIVKKET